MLSKLVEGISPTDEDLKHSRDCNIEMAEVDPFTPRCLPTKGALQCIEEFPKFSAECIDQFIHKRDVSFDEIEEHWIRNPLLDFCNADETVTETEVA